MTSCFKTLSCNVFFRRARLGKSPLRDPSYKKADVHIQKPQRKTISKEENLSVDVLSAMIEENKAQIAQINNKEHEIDNSLLDSGVSSGESEDNKIFIEDNETEKKNGDDEILQHATKVLKSNGKSKFRNKIKVLVVNQKMGFSEKGLDSPLSSRSSDRDNDSIAKTHDSAETNNADKISNDRDSHCSSKSSTKDDNEDNGLEKSESVSDVSEHRLAREPTDPKVNERKHRLRNAFVNKSGNGISFGDLLKFQVTKKIQ